MKIVGATPWYVPEGGGLERYAHHVFRRIAARGNEVRVFTFTRGAPRDEDVDGVWVTRLDPGLVVSNTPVGALLPRAVKRAARDADVVVGHGPVPFAAESAAVAARAAGAPFVFTYHAGGLRGGSPGLDAAARLNRWTLEKHAFSSASGIVTVSPLVADGYLSRYRQKVHVIPPGVDADAFKPGPDPEDRDPTILYVGPVSRAYAWKGFPVLFDAFTRLAREREDARLVVIGEGDLVEPYGREARREGLEDRVTFRGRVSDAALAEAYASARVVTLPSTSDAESFGMVLAEANACGTPVVASRVGGVPAFVRHGENGLLVEPGEVGALADALARVLRDTGHAQRMGALGRERVLREHDWDAIATRNLKVYEEALLAHAVA